MKTKRKSLVLSLLLCLVLACTSLMALAAPKAKAEVATADLVGGGTAYTEPSYGTVTYTTQAVTDGKEASYSGALYTTSSAASELNLGTIDITGITPENPLISFLPYFGKASDYNPTFSGFKIVFSSGEKSVTVRSFVRKNTDFGLTAGANGQSLRGWNWSSGAEDSNAVDGADIAVGTRPFRLNGQSTGRSETFYYTDGSTATKSTAKIEPIKVYFGEDAEGNYSVYTDLAMQYSTKNNGGQTFNFGGADTTRFLIADLEGYSSAPWTAFTAEEMQNVNVTLQLLGVTAESKFLITELDGQAITETAVNGFSAGKVSTLTAKTTDGVARTLTDGESLTVANQAYLADNDAITPLAKIALLPKTYGTQAATTIAIESSSYTTTSETEYGKATPYNSNRYWVSDTAKAEFEAAIAASDAKNTRDVDAVYMDFRTDTKNVTVKLTFRMVNDNGAMPTSYMVRVNDTDEYKAAYVSNGGLNTARATLAASAIRFDGYVQSGNEYDEKGVQQLSKGANQDPIYAVYYDAETNTLYTDSGRMNGLQTNIGTSSDPLYRWKIADLDDLGFAGFGDERVTVSVKADIRDKGESGLSDDSANIMIMNVDGQELTNDGTNVTAAAVSSEAYGYDETVYAQIGATHGGQLFNSYSLLTGEETEYSSYTMTALGPDGNPVECPNDKITPAASGEYKITLTGEGKSITYSLMVGAKRTTAEVISKFTEVGEATTHINGDISVTDISYAELPDYMKFSGAGIKVTQRNMPDSYGDDITYDSTTIHGTWGVQNQISENVGLGVGFNGINLDESSSVIKVAFPGINEAWGMKNGAFMHGMKITDPESGRWIHVYFITNDPNTSSIMIKAIGSWERMGYTGLIREAGSDSEGAINTAWLAHSGIDADEDGTITGDEIAAKNNAIFYQAGVRVLSGSRANAEATTPLEIKLDNATGKLSVVYGGVETVIRDFATISAAAADYAEGETEYPTGNLKGALLTGKFAENGIVDIQFGVDMTNPRNRDANDKVHPETAYTIMSLGGVELTESEAGYIIDTSAVREVNYTGPSQMFALDDETAYLTFTETRMLGTYEVQAGKIQVEDMLSEGDYVGGGNLFTSNDTYDGTHEITYTHETGVKTAALKIVSKLSVSAGANGTVTVTDAGGNPVADMSALDVTQAYTITVVPNAGYEIASFTVDGDDRIAELNGGAFAWAANADATEHATVSVTFAPETYNISYDLAGGTGTNNNVTSYDVEDDDITFVPLVDAVKTGYTFDGWAIGGSKVTTYDTATMGDITVTALWKANTYTITFNTNGGSTTADAEADYDTLLTAPTAPTKTGYTFGGWYKEAALTNAWDFATDKVTEDTTLYAKWTLNTYTITYELDGGTVTHTNPASYTVEDDDITIAAPTAATKTGYTFGGWSVTTIDTAGAVNVTVTAQWTINTYSVTFTDGVAAQTVNHGAKATEPTDPTKTGYTFGGWYVGETAYDFDAAVTADVALTAKWTIKTYTVTFDTDGGSAVASATVNHGAKVTEPTADPTKEGYTFAGWYVGTTEYDFDAVVTADLTVKAKWTAVAADPAPDTTPDDTTPDEKKGCGEEAVGLLAVVLSALAAAFVIKKN